MIRPMRLISVTVFALAASSMTTTAAHANDACATDPAWCYTTPTTTTTTTTTTTVPPTTTTTIAVQAISVQVARPVAVQANRVASTTTTTVAPAPMPAVEVLGAECTRSGNLIAEVINPTTAVSTVGLKAGGVSTELTVPAGATGLAKLALGSNHHQTVVVAVSGTATPSVTASGCTNTSSTNRESCPTQWWLLILGIVVGLTAGLLLFGRRNVTDETDQSDETPEGLDQAEAGQDETPSGDEG